MTFQLYSITNRCECTGSGDFATARKISRKQVDIFRTVNRARRAPQGAAHRAARGRQRVAKKPSHPSAGARPRGADDLRRPRRGRPRPGGRPESRSPGHRPPPQHDHATAATTARGRARAGGRGPGGRAAKGGSQRATRPQGGAAPGAIQWPRFSKKGRPAPAPPTKGSGPPGRPTTAGGKPNKAAPREGRGGPRPTPHRGGRARGDDPAPRPLDQGRRPRPGGETPAAAATGQTTTEGRRRRAQGGGSNRAAARAPTAPPLLDTRTLFRHWLRR